MYTKIISVEKTIELLSSGASPRCVCFDTRFQLGDWQYGKHAFDREHIAGAFYLHLQQHLSGPVTSTSGRHPLPNINAFGLLMRMFGVSSNTQVIAYDDAGGMFAARLWWLLKWLGHDNVAVLDGGWQAWLKHGGPITDAHAAVPAFGEFVPMPRADMVVTALEVMEGVANHSITLCDARAPERYRGDVEPIDSVAGHVPGAINVPYMANLDSNLCFHSPEILRTLHASTADNVVQMCGSGVTACHNILAYAIAGLPLPKLYVGSWSEWIRDPQRGIAVGS